MRCRYCGHDIPEGILYCEHCGEEVRIVPDYNPLDDVLEAQVRGAIDGSNDTSVDEDLVYDYGTPSRGNDERRTNAGRNTSARRNTSSGRNTSARRNTSSGRNTGARRNTSSGRNTSSRRNTQPGRNTSGRNTTDRDQRRRQAERKKALKKKKRRRMLIILAVIMIAAAILGIVLYQNSYAGIVSKGYRAEKNQEYDQAVSYFKKAISKKPAKPEAYTGLSKVYIAQKDLDSAETAFQNAVDKQTKNVELYEAFINFYMDTDQKAEIPVLLDDASDHVADELKGYIIKAPKFSLDDAETYDDVQQLSLTSGEKTIYYTTDGSEPTVNSTKYTEPIHLEEGETEVSAISVDKRGIPSLPVKKTYTIELPIADAPAVSPSTGQYDTPSQIEIKVPEGYEAYYTLDRTDPTTDSEKYEGPIDMPSGETIFKAVLVDKKGRLSGITTRNYVLESE